MALTAAVAHQQRNEDLLHDATVYGMYCMVVCLPQDMNEELNVQQTKLEHIDNRTANTLGGLKEVQQSARQDFNIRQKGWRPARFLPIWF